MLEKQNGFRIYQSCKELRIRSSSDDGIAVRFVLLLLMMKMIPIGFSEMKCVSHNCRRKNKDKLIPIKLGISQRCPISWKKNYLKL
jgi:hypothetical protein